MGAFVISPLPPFLIKTACAAGPLGSAGITPLRRYYGPSRHRLVFPRFPAFAVIRGTLLPPFPGGTRTVSPVAQHALATVLPLPPRRSEMRLQPDCLIACCLRLEQKGSAFGLFLSRPPLSSLTLRPGDSLTIPRMALSVGFIRFVSSTNATQATGLLTIAPVGLSPTEHASLRWTHWFSETRSERPASGWPVFRFSTRRLTGNCRRRDLCAVGK